MKGKWQDGEFDGQGLVATGTTIAAGTWIRFCCLMIVLWLSCLVLWLSCLVIVSCLVSNHVLYWSFYVTWFVKAFLERRMIPVFVMSLLSCCLALSSRCRLFHVLFSKTGQDRARQEDVVPCRRLVFCLVFFCRVFSWSYFAQDWLTTLHYFELDSLPACTSLFLSCQQECHYHVYFCANE